MEQLRAVLFKDIPTVRISDTFSQPEMATDFLEHDLKKLDILWQRGRESFVGIRLLMCCCAGDEGSVALRRRSAGSGVKPPHGALAEDCCAER